MMTGFLLLQHTTADPGNVNKAIRRSGNKKDYWDIYYRLPRETRGYIPSMLLLHMQLIIIRNIIFMPMQLEYSGCY